MIESQGTDGAGAGAKAGLDDTDTNQKALVSPDMMKSFDGDMTGGVDSFKIG